MNATERRSILWKCLPAVPFLLLLCCLAVCRSTSWNLKCPEVCSFLQTTYRQEFASKPQSAWPKTVKGLRSLIGGLDSSGKLLTVGGRCYQVDYYPREDYPSGLLLRLYRVNPGGRPFIIWTEAYVLRRDGKVALGAGWDTFSMWFVLLVLIWLLATGLSVRAIWRAIRGAHTVRAMR